jgi:ribosomal protein L11 methyltransferase
MDFITVSIQAGPELAEVLQAELADIGFEAFLELEDGFEASIQQSSFQESLLQETLEPYGMAGAYRVQVVPKQNWNALWESNFQPLAIDSDCYIRAHFHAPQPGFRYELVITPKMSFGTGHHATTEQMIRQQLLVPHEGKRVFDIGCGTGILAIMAAKLGATQVDACDIEDWSVENARENAEANGVEVQAYVGEAAAKRPQTYDILLANINRHVLLADMPIYRQLLAPGGWLLLSGFRPDDLPLLLEAVDQAQLRPVRRTQQGDWMCLVCQG